jgi:MHS family proline/betaine transporter-like MFS transporter
MSDVAPQLESETQREARRHRLVIAGVVGNILEWYDFSVYGFFAPAIGENFFPSKSESASLIAAFGVFAAGFLMRPVGALLFGYIGDHRGRERALTLSVLAMAIPTFLIGLLPTHAQAGNLAPILMVVLRLIQGLSVGGEYTTSVVFLVEQAPAGKRGLNGAIGVGGAFAGAMLGSAVGTLVAWNMPTRHLLAWGWRIPFLLGIAIGVAGYYLRRELRFVEPQPRRESPAMLEIIRTQWLRIIQVTGFKIFDAVGFYLMFVFSTTYLEEIVGLTRGHAMAINTLGMAGVLGVLPLAGMLSDRIGRKPVLLISAGALIIFAIPLFNLLWHPAFSVPLIGQLGFAIIIAMCNGASPAAAVEAFPANVRCSGVAISHNLCMALFGGTAPLVATYLIDRTANEMAPPIYLMVAAAISALFTLTLRETAKTPLAD